MANERSKPKVVALDLDGTLLRSDRTISDRTVAALDHVRQAGSILVLVTARPFRYLRDVADRLGHTGLALCSNGALVYDLASERVVESHALSVDLALEVVARLRATLPMLAYLIETPQGYAADVQYGAEPGMTALEIGDIADLVRRHSVIKLVARHEDFSPDALTGVAREALGSLAEVTHSGAGWLEVNPAGISKASTLAAACAERGISAAEVVAFGDMPNDLPMLAWAGRGYAMANAHPDVLAATSLHAPSNDEDGVAVILEQLFV